MPEGLLLSEASHWDLHTYIDEIYHLVLRKKWCHQVAESVAYLHRHCLIHSDLYPGNFLVHAAIPGSRGLWLCDFGGSVCQNLGLDGWHPRQSFL